MTSSATRSDHRDVWLIVPCFNEGPVIRQVLTEALHTFPNIVCVDDGSSDDSRREIDQTAAFRITHRVNLGQGAALQTGIEFARSRQGANYFATFDADGQHLVQDVVAMVHRLREEPIDLILGTRFAPGSSTNISRRKRFVLRTAVTLGPNARRLGLTDVHNGLRAFNRTVADQVELTINGMGHASELTALAVDNGWRVTEQPVTIAYTDYSMAKGQPMLNSINIVVDHLLHKRGN